MHRPTRTLATASGIAVAVALTLAGCGDDSSGTAATTTTTASSTKAPVQLSGPVTDRGHVDVSDQGAHASVEIEAYDNAFDPTFIKAAPGAEVTVKVKNDGKNDHTFTVTGDGVDQQVAPGEEAKVTVTVPRSGPLRFECRFHGSMGMQGAFYTAPTASASGGPDSTARSSTPTSSDGGSGGY